MSGIYEREAQSLEKAYWEAVGWALQYGLKVHVKGRMRALGDLQDAINDHEAKTLGHNRAGRRRWAENIAAETRLARAVKDAEDRRYAERMKREYAE